MIVKFILSIVLIFYYGNLSAQHVVGVLPFQKDDIRYGTIVKKILKKNGIGQDSLTARIHKLIFTGLNQKLPGVKLVFADESILKIIADSSETEHMLTTSHQEAIVGKDGFERIQVRVEMGSTFYFGRVFTPGGIELMKVELQKSGSEYFILLSELEAEAEFRIQYEVYDSNFVKVFGDKFVENQTLSKNMYYDALMYYVDNYIQNFNEELCKQLRF